MYYLDATQNGCNSVPRTAVRAAVNLLPLKRATIAGPTAPYLNSSENVYSMTQVVGVTPIRNYSGSGESITAGKGSNAITVGYSSSPTSGIWTVKTARSLGVGEPGTLEINPLMLFVSPECQIVSPEAGNNVLLFNVLCDTNWTVSCDQAWCELTPSASFGNGTISATYFPNTADTSRTANITVAISGSSPLGITLKQAGTSDKVLSLTLFLEGLFNNATMNKAQNAWGDHYPGSIADVIMVELHDAFNPYNQIGPAYPVNLNTDGSATVYIHNVYSGNYYVVIKNRNHVETCSAYPISFEGSTIAYDFSDYSTKAFGNQLKLIANKYCSYGGDVNQDGIVDALDLIYADNLSAAFGSGYMPEDANGDGLVNTNDISIVANNAGNFIQSMFPVPSDLPCVVASSAGSLTNTTATASGNVTAQGSSVVTTRGVCWSTNPNPTLNDDFTIDGAGLGTFISNISGLTANTTYSLRAYATNSAGTAYGNQVTFTTFNIIPCPGMPTVTDSRDGHVYNTVKIGTQCWLKENMALETDLSCCYNNDPNMVSAYGRLYSGGIAGEICPSGWHLPAVEEWDHLNTTVAGLAGKLKSTGTLETGTGLWYFPNTGATNESGFTAIPSGSAETPVGDPEINFSYYGLGFNAGFWTSSYDYRGYALDMFLSNISNSLGGSYERYYPYTYLSVRCVKDCDIPITPPSPGTNIPSQNQILWQWEAVPGATGYKVSWNAPFSDAFDVGLVTTYLQTDNVWCNDSFILNVWAYNDCETSAMTQLTATTPDCSPLIKDKEADPKTPK
jgi:uncharacterized protein (TIGR02145 family)